MGDKTPLAVAGEACTQYTEELVNPDVITVMYRQESILRLSLALGDAGCSICERAIKVFENPVIEMMPSHLVMRPFTFRVVSVEGLGISRKIGYEQLREHILKKGFWLCPFPDVALHLLKQMPQRLDDKAMCIPCEIRLYIIENGEKKEVFLMAEKSVGRFFLDTRQGGPAADFMPEDLLVLFNPR